MGRNKVHHSTLLRTWIEKLKEPGIFRVDGTGIFCQVFTKMYEVKQQSQLTQHAASTTHKTNLQKFQENSEKKNQIPLKTALEHGNEFYFELCEGLWSAGVPWNQIQNPALRNCLEKYMKRNLPDESTLGKFYVPKVYDSCILKIQEEIGDSPIYLQIDETTDVKGRYMANVLVGALRKTASSKSHLILVYQLEKTNNATISRTVLEALELFWPKKTQQKIADRFLLFLTDAAPYMAKAGKNLKKTYPDFIHVTCLAHALHNVAEKVRTCFGTVDNLIASVKAVFRKSPSRVVKLKTLFPDLELPPNPILVRWGTWIDAVKYYSSNIESIKTVLDSFPEDEAVCIAKAKSACEKNDLETSLKELSENFVFLSDSILKLEKQVLTLEDQIGIVQDVEFRICQISSNAGRQVNRKMAEILEKDKGLKQIKEIFQFLSKQIAYEEISVNMPEEKLEYFWHAPLTTVDTERSFSMEKNLLSGREKMTPENIGKHLVAQYELSFCK